MKWVPCMYVLLDVLQVHTIRIISQWTSERRVSMLLPGLLLTLKWKESAGCEDKREKGEKGLKSKKAEDKMMDDTQSEVSYAMPDNDLTRSKASKKAFSESHLPLHPSHSPRSSWWKCVAYSEMSSTRSDVSSSWTIGWRSWLSDEFTGHVCIYLMGFYSQKMYCDSYCRT